MSVSIRNMANGAKDERTVQFHMEIQRKWLKRQELGQVKRMRIERIEMFGG